MPSIGPGSYPSPLRRVCTSRMPSTPNSVAGGGGGRASEVADVAFGVTDLPCAGGGGVEGRPDTVGEETPGVDLVA